MITVRRATVHICSDGILDVPLTALLQAAISGPTLGIEGHLLYFQAEETTSRVSTTTWTPTEERREARLSTCTRIFWLSSTERSHCVTTRT
ncbi:hypothetical protein AFLA_009621 [Aspergillus flavus NRRL3357]|nr:hypothetical protein AFLA_009621 [Aspergillus flavus NRRL3357]